MSETRFKRNAYWMKVISITAIRTHWVYNLKKTIIWTSSYTAPQCPSITWTLLSHLCGAIWSNTLTITCPTGTPLCIITGADTPIQHHHGVRHYDNADHTQHCCQEQFHWWWGHKWNLTVGDTTTHRFNAHYRALPGITTVCQQQLTMSINSFKLQGIRATNQSDTLMITFQRVPPPRQLSADLYSFVFYLCNDAVNSSSGKVLVWRPWGKQQITCHDSNSQSEISTWDLWNKIQC